ncbi:hypothetical protein TSAR_005909 [Trichomalopsis sarcophagae]|uniref:HAT C-terminal dimerisation domain-containing protein n=1 Tax=Trichomalopsis sarcophagae TaxID=543379 RepID=A0A232EPM5_9HYME|nr:hypothetical protein TSAR_005909 [Trichomalopsis sarcophagae]
MKKILLEEFAHRFDKIEYMSLIAIATILDPRFKRLYFSDKMACTNAVNKITKALNHDIIETSKASCENNSPNKNQFAKTNDFWVHHHKLVQENNSRKIQNQNSNEMPEEVIDRNKNPIMFWPQYPNSELSKIAIRFVTNFNFQISEDEINSRHFREYILYRQWKQQAEDKADDKADDKDDNDAASIDYSSLEDMWNERWREGRK